MNAHSKLLLSTIPCFLLLAMHAPAAVKNDPATVENGRKESSLATVTLTEKAEQRLGVETAPVKLNEMSRVMKLGGEVVAVPGQTASITAPVTGTVLYGNLSAGMPVEKGQVIMRLSLMPPLQELMNIEEEVKIKEAEYNLARTKTERAERLLAEKAVSEKSLQQAKAELAAAEGALNIAKSRVDLLKEGADESLPSMVLESPLNGVLQDINVAPGQMVPASAPLFSVVSQHPIWIKVPVYAGDLSRINGGKQIRIEPLGEVSTTSITHGEPVQGPPSSDAASATTYLFYKADNQTGALRVGQKVMTQLPLNTMDKSLMVNYSAIVYDMYGGTWVYLKIAPQTYSRRRVELSHVVDGNAIITRGVNAGDEVVVTAAAEIFGTEFGGGK